MPNYRRIRSPGETYFFTVTLADRSNRILIDNFDLLSHCFAKVRDRQPFKMPGWVILPDHLHCIWKMPELDFDYSSRWWAIKSLFTKNCRKRLNNPSITIWQQRFWEHRIRNQNDYNRHMDYIHINPLKHGLVSQVKNWPYSSFHSLVPKGIYPENWAGSKKLMENDFGE